MGVWYASVEDVKTAPDWQDTARNRAQITRALEASSRNVERLCHRLFYPQLATRYFDWPDPVGSLAWRLWLNQYEVLAVTELTAGDTTIAASDYLLEPANDGPPYDRVEINISTQAGFSIGSTSQRAIALTGTFGATQDTDSAGTLAAAISSTTATTVDVSDSSQDSGVGLGNPIKVDSEWMLVTAKSMLTTGQTLGAPGLTSSKANVTVPVTTGSSYAVGETILIDSERMLVEDIAGNNLIVRRAYDGTVLAAHTAGATIYAPRRLTVTRGALGTTAATHSNSAAVARLAVPGLVRQLTVAEVLVDINAETSGYARQPGPGDASKKKTGALANPLDDLRARCYTAHGRKLRTWAV